MSKIAIIYWSGTGNTEKMAQAILEGVNESGNSGELFTVDAFRIDDMEKFDRFAFGCPSMGCEVLEESEFEPFFCRIETLLSGKKVALFGSYGWGDGQWMRDWQQRVLANGVDLFEEGLLVNGEPEEDDNRSCKLYGQSFARY